MSNSNSHSNLPSIAEFEALKVDPETFDHTAHLFVAWSYLQEHDLPTSIKRYRETLIRLTRELGVPDKYHETITWFYLIVIAERIAEQAKSSWQQFVESNPDLFASKPRLINQFYSQALIASDTARHTFVLPKPLSVDSCAGAAT